MSEQDRYESHFNIPPGARPHINYDALNRGPGAEQDVHGSHFGIRTDRFKWPNRSGDSGIVTAASAASEQDLYTSHFSLDPTNPIEPFAVGILRSTLLPSIGFHSGLAVVVYAASRSVDRVDGKDWLWPSGQVLNAWWCAVGTHVVNDHISIGTAFSHLAYSEKLLLTGVTAWGARLFYRIASRSLTRKRDNPRFDAAKKEEGFWNKALFQIFLPEALFQAVISLPFTLPFKAISASALASPLHVHPEYTHGLAVALFSAGLAMEILADVQLATYQKKDSEHLDREGVWSIVRHPNALGDALIHASFPLVLWSAGIMHPLALLGPVANYVFLRSFEGDAENERAQEQGYVKKNPTKYAQLQAYKRETNSFWPKPEEIRNPWTWAVVAAGFGGFVLERSFRSYIHKL